MQKSSKKTELAISGFELAELTIPFVIRTNVGKMRAWMRLALMQKLLAEQLIALVEEKEILRY